MRNFDDTTIVALFVKHLNKSGHPNIKIDRIPDKEKIKGDRKKDIDAVAGHFAIEHTSFDTVKNQTLDSVRFLEVVRDLEAEITPRLNYLLRISLPYLGIRKGQQWSSMRESLNNWIMNSSSKLSDGKHIIDDVPGIPFQLHIIKASGRKPGLIFVRSEPENNDFINRLKDHLNRKARKLKSYKAKGFHTILLLESDDPALMDDSIMLDGIRVAFAKKLPCGVDEIWYADTSNPEKDPENILFSNLTMSIYAETI